MLDIADLMVSIGDKGALAKFLDSTPSTKYIRDVISHLSKFIRMNEQSLLDSTYILGGSLTRNLETILEIEPSPALGGDIDIAMSDSKVLTKFLYEMIRVSGLSTDVMVLSTLESEPRSKLVNSTKIVSLADTSDVKILRFNLSTNTCEVIDSLNGRSVVVFTSESKSQLDIQLVLGANQTPQEAIDSIDFGVCKLALTLAPLDLLVGKSNTYSDYSGFLVQLVTRSLEYDDSSRDPVNSLTRTYKYIARGYSITGESLTKLLLRVMNEDPELLDLRSYKLITSTGSSKDSSSGGNQGY